MLFCRCRQITARRFVWLGVLAAIPTLALGAETPRIQGVYSNIAMTPSEDYQGMEVIVSLTDTGYYAVLQCASGADATRPVVVPVKVDEERGTLACACTTPRATTLAFSSPQGHFGMVPCELSQDDPLAPAEFHFVHRGADDDGALAESYPIPDPANASNVQANDRYVVWMQSRGHGSFDLMPGAPGAEPQQLVRGGWELESTRLDRVHSRVLYGTDTGIVVQDLAGGTPRRIEGTRRGDVPMDFSGDTSWLVFLRKGTCDAAAAATQGWHVCLARLPQP